MVTYVTIHMGRQSIYLIHEFVILIVEREKTMENNMTNKKMGIGKLILRIFVAALILGFLYVGIVWGFSDRIVRISFTGFDNFFNVHDEYYAIAGPFSVRIPKQLAQVSFDQDVENIDDADEESGRVFLVSVDWSEDCKPVFSSWEPFLISHDYSEHYIIDASPWDAPRDSRIPASAEEQAIIMDIAEHFYDFEKEYDPNTDKDTSYTAGNWTAFWFMVYINGDKCTFELHQPGRPETVYSYNKDGLVKFQKNMTVPSKGHFDTTMFK